MYERNDEGFFNDASLAPESLASFNAPRAPRPVACPDCHLDTNDVNIDQCECLPAAPWKGEFPLDRAEDMDAAAIEILLATLRTGESL